MSIRSKTALLILAIFVALLTIIGVSLQRIIAGHFARLEAEDVTEDLRRIEASLDEDARTLARTLRDWARWDASYHFIVSRNAEYIATNLNDASLLNLELNVILYLDTRGRVVFARAVDSRLERAIPFPPRLRQALVTNTLLTRLRTSPSHIEGVLHTPSGLLLVAAQPILRNDSTGPSRGTLIMGRFLAGEEMTRREQMLAMRLALQPYALATAPQGIRDGDRTSFEPIDATRGFGYLRLDDLKHHPVGLVRLTVTRTIYQQGVRTQQLLLTVLTGIGAAFVLITLFLVQQLVVTRLTTLQAEIGKIQDGSNLDARIPTRATPRLPDEVDHVRQAINDMLTALADAQARTLHLEVLRESEAQYHVLTDQSPEAICLVRHDRFVLANPAACRLLGVRDDDALLGRSVWDFVLPEQRESLTADIQRLSMEPGTAEVMIRRADGTLRDIELRASRFLFNEQPAIQVLAHDITERKRIQHALLMHQARLRALATTLAQTEERERRRLATILHDQLGQLLVVVRMMLGTVQEDPGRPDNTALLTDSRRLLEEAIVTTRTLTLDLSPPILYEQGLVPALRWLADNHQDRSRLLVAVVADDDLPALPQALRGLLFQIVQELLHNVVKHAQADQASVHVRIAGGAITLKVWDNGRGYQVSDDVPTSGFGLFNIRERAEQLGGRMEIRIPPEGGTAVTVTLPTSDAPLPGGVT
jgi:PAS domain S-box-containing protein